MLAQRMAQLRAPGTLVILADMKLGVPGAEDERVGMDADQHMGALYPFSRTDNRCGIAAPMTPRPSRHPGRTIGALREINA
jgi:hypothetical protein